MWHRASELTSLTAASATVIAAGLGAPALITALAAGLTLFATGFRQVFNPGAVGCSPRGNEPSSGRP